MRDAFQRVLPSIPVLDAPASQLPFESGSVDCVFVAQAFHWFCNEGIDKLKYEVLNSYTYLWNFNLPCNYVGLLQAF